MTDAFDLSSTFVHLGLGSRAHLLADFEWSDEYLAGYEAEHGGDAGEGRLVMIGHEDATWTSWERHPLGDELVVLLSGRVDVVQEVDGAERVVPLTAGMALVNPAGTWHRAVVHEAGEALFVTPGFGTEHRPLD
jgi:mannose-6-phosphate isomerase-like protein (cupin superfamily)